MRIVRDKTWRRRGLALLWGGGALAEVAKTDEIVPLRAFLSLAESWPDDLPSDKGNALVVAGVEGVLDSLTPDDAEKWLEEDLKPLLFSFQEEYEGQGALILWLPSGRQRVHMKRASESYLWHCGPASGRKTLPIGRVLWAGAEADAGRVLDPSEKNQDPDGTAWIGLHLPRIS